MRSWAEISGEANSRHTCHCTCSGTISMSRAWPVTPVTVIKPLPPLFI